MSRRPLAETLSQLADGAQSFTGDPQSLRIASLSINVPLEIRLRRTAGELEILGDVPLWRWQTGMEEERGRLLVRWEELLS